MMQKLPDKMLTAQILTKEAFAPFGDVLEISGEASKLINKGKCGRYHDLAKLDFADDDNVKAKDKGRAGISLFNSEIFSLPIEVDLLERHPLGSQAFIPVSQNLISRFLVVVAQDDNGKPCNLQAFVTQIGQSINIHRNIWHAPLCPLKGNGDADETDEFRLFAVVDWIGERANLQEYCFDVPYVVEKIDFL